jgi:hypothetical protein
MRLAIRIGVPVFLMLVVLAKASASSSGGPVFFAMSPMRATLEPSTAAIRFKVSLGSIPTHNRPDFHWRLSLAPASATRACENGRLAGGQRVGKTDVVWASQGGTFIWFVGRAAGKCAGDVSVVAENEYEHCSATLEVPQQLAELRSGAPASCSLGGYSIGPSTLPVPSALLHSFAQSGSELRRLPGEILTGSISTGQLVTLVDQLLGMENRSLANLFPPVYGCPFDTVFQPVLGSAIALDEQPSGTGLAGVSSGLSAAVTQLRTCGTAASPGAIAALDKVASRAKSDLSTPPRGRALAAELRGLGASLDAVLRAFPAVLGIPYVRLVEQVAKLNTAMSEARKRAAAGDSQGAAAALKTAAGPTGFIRDGLVRHQRHVVQVENANG